MKNQVKAIIAQLNNDPMAMLLAPMTDAQRALNGGEERAADRFARISEKLGQSNDGMGPFVDPLHGYPWA